MAVTVTPEAAQVLRRSLELGRMDPAAVAVRLRVVRGLGGSEVQTGFADEPEPGEVVVEAAGVRLFVDASLAEAGAVVDVAAEHERIVVR